MARSISLPVFTGILSAAVVLQSVWRCDGNATDPASFPNQDGLFFLFSTLSGSANFDSFL
jgi:hypothetical protein